MEEARKNQRHPKPKDRHPSCCPEQKCCAVLDSCGAKDTAGTATPQVQLNSWQEPGVQPQHLKAALTQADKNSLQGLIGGCLQVEEGQLVVSAQLHLVADGFKQRGGAVQLGGKTATVTSSRTLHSTARASSHP